MYSFLQNVCSCRTLLCDIDNNWVLLLFTSCRLLTLSLDLVGSMGKGEVDLHKFDNRFRFCKSTFVKNNVYIKA